MAKITPITLKIDRNPNNSKFIVYISYVVSGSGNDITNEQNYREVCQLIGDDTPGDGTDDILRTVFDTTTVFEGIIGSHIQRIFQFEVTRGELDEDNRIFIPEDDEIRARVTLTPIPTTRESNLIRLIQQPDVNQPA